MNLFEKADAVLGIIYEHGVKATPEKIETIKPITSFGQLKDILKKLEKDGFVSSGHERFGSGDKMYDKDGDAIKHYALTFEGEFFLLQGGYIGQSLRNAAENNRLKALEDDQRLHRFWMTIITFGLLIVGIVSAVYYLIEIAKACR